MLSEQHLLPCSGSFILLILIFSLLKDFSDIFSPGHQKKDYIATVFEDTCMCAQKGPYIIESFPEL